MVPKELPLNSDLMRIEKHRPHYKVENSMPSYRILQENQRLPKEAFHRDDRLRFTQVMACYHSFSVLKAYNMLNHAEGKEQCPPEFMYTDEDEKENHHENPAYTIWLQRDQVFLTWINASLSPKLLRYTRECTSGQALWMHLEDVLSKSAEARVLGLKARLQNLEFNTLEKYLWQARAIAAELEAAGSPINDSELTSCILGGLPEFYEEVVASIRNKPDPVTQIELYDLLLSHMTRKNAQDLSHRTRKNAQALVPGLKARLQNLSYNSYLKDMRGYLREAREISDGLEAGGSPVNDLELTSRILEGLPKRYQKRIASITNQPHLLTPQELRNLLLSHTFPYPQELSDTICRYICFVIMVILVVGFGFFVFLVILRLTGRQLDLSEFKIIKV